MRATHGIELFYVFKTTPGGVQAEEADIRVADAMHAAWLRFAESGDPNGKGFRSGRRFPVRMTHILNSATGW